MLSTLPSTLLAIPLLLVSSFVSPPHPEAPVDVKEEAKKVLHRPLTAAEVVFLEKIPSGLAADFRPAGESKVDEKLAMEWGDDRLIDAKLIAWLCTTPNIASLVTYKGLHIQGARIHHKLDLADAKIPFPIAITSSFVPDEINFSDAELASLVLEGSRVGLIVGRSARVKGDIRLNNLVKAEKADVSNAQIGGDFDCGGSLFSNPNPKDEAIYADYLTVGRDVVMNGGFRAESQVRLAGAIIDGDINCNGSSFLNARGVALNASGVIVKGNAYLQIDQPPKDSGMAVRPFAIEGTFELSNARISGNLHCAGGSFLGSKSENGNAIRAHGLNVSGDVHLDDKFQSEGRVDLTVAQIGGSLECLDGHFSCIPHDADGRKDIAGTGIALDLGSSTVGHDVVLGPGFTAQGVVRMEGLSVGGRLNCSRGKFQNPKGAAIEGSWISVKGSVYLGEPKRAGQAKGDCTRSFEARGIVRLVNARIGNDLFCSNGCFSANEGENVVLDASGAVVEGNAFLCDGFHASGKVKFNNAKITRYIYIRSNMVSEIHELDLDSARAGALHYAADVWPGEKKLFIDGFSYDLLDENTSLEIPQGGKSKHVSWIDWLKLQGRFSSAPYEQLAGVLAKAGKAEEAKAVLVEKERQNASKILSHDPSILDWLWYRWVGPSISFGYNPLGASWYGLGFIVAGTVIFHRAYMNRQFVAKDSRPDAPTPYFNAFIYSVDLFVPIISLYLRENWVLIRSPGPDFKRFLLRAYWLIHIVAGWTITSLSVAGLLGWIRHD